MEGRLAAVGPDGEHAHLGALLEDAPADGARLEHVVADDHVVGRAPVDGQVDRDVLGVLADDREAPVCCEVTPDDLSQHLRHVDEENADGQRRRSSTPRAVLWNSPLGPTALRRGGLEPLPRVLGHRYYGPSLEPALCVYWRARAATSLRRRTSSLAKIVWTWFFTVGSSMQSRLAISLFVSPSAISATIADCRSVSCACERSGRRSAASAVTRRSSVAAICGEQSISPRTTLSIVATRSSIEP